MVFTGYSANKSDHHDIAEILLKVALKTINHPTNHNSMTETLTRGCIMKLYRHMILAFYARVYANNGNGCIYQRYIHTSIRISIASVYMNHIYEGQIDKCGYPKYGSKRQYGAPVRYCPSLVHSKD